MNKIFLLLLLSIILFLRFSMQILDKENMPYQNKNLSIEERIEDLLKRMTLEEKIEMIGGTGFATKPIFRLGIHL